MINSMTGFASYEHKSEFGSFIWEIRSVNQRFLEQYFKLPDEFRSIESSTRDIVKQELERGKVECTLKFNPNIDTETVHFNEKLAKQLVANAEKVNSFLTDKSVARFNPIEILMWPGVINSGNADDDQVKNAAIEAFKTTIIKLKEARQREGEKLLTILLDKLEKIESEVALVKTHLPNILAWQKEKIETAFKDLNLRLNPERLEQEIILIAQRIDVAEELDRLNSHVSETRSILNKGGSCGRRLDFMMQEFNRESNTLASKSINVDVTNSAIELKVLIEQMREQIQNIE